MKIYKIQDTVTGLFSTGGARPSWSNSGKAWKGIGPLKNHLHQVRQSDYKNAIVVEMEYVETCVTTTPVADMLDVMNRATVAKEQKERQARDNRLKARRLEEFNRLKAEFQPV